MLGSSIFHLCMYVCMYVCMLTYVHMHTLLWLGSSILHLCICMHACMYVNISTYAHTIVAWELHLPSLYMCVCMRVCMLTHVHMHTRELHTCMHGPEYVCTQLWLRSYILHLCTCVCGIYVCMHVDMCTYTYTIVARELHICMHWPAYVCTCTYTAVA